MRRVKCDEVKPICSRCAAGGIACAGYDLPQPWLFEPSVSTIDKLEEVRAIDEFVKEGAIILSKFELSSLPFMTLVAPQMSQSHTTVKLAILALNMRQRCIRQQSQQQPGDKDPSVAAALSLSLYNKSITQFCQTPRHNRSPVEVALACCLLFSALDLLDYKSGEAAIHVQAGFRLILEHLSRKAPDAMHELPTTLAHSDTSSDPVISLFLPIFTFLSIDGYAFTDHFSLAQFPHISDDYALAYGLEIPEAFADLCEAHKCLNTLLRCVLRATESNENRLLEPTHARQAVLEQASILLSWFPVALQRTRQVSSIKAHSCFRSDFEALAIHYRVIRMMSNTYSFTDETIFDQYLRDFQFILTGCERLFRIGLNQRLVYGRPFGCTLGILAPLFFVATRCRRPVLRRRAISLLHTSLRRERKWNSCFATMLARFVVHLEEGSSPAAQLYDPCLSSYPADNDVYAPGGRVKLVAVDYAAEDQIVTVDYQHSTNSHEAQNKTSKFFWNCKRKAFADMYVKVPRKVIRASGYYGIILAAPPISCVCSLENQ